MTEDKQSIISGSRDEAARKFEIAGGQDVPDIPSINNENLPADTTIPDFKNVHEMPATEKQNSANENTND